MVNHLRTLILNLSSAPDAENEELIESSFGPRTLTASQAAIRAAVFPANFSRPYLNFIATLLARLVQDSPLAADLQALDHRLLLSSPTAAQFKPEAVVVNDLNAISLEVRGELTPMIDTGIFSNTWMITYAGASEISIRNLYTGISRNETVVFSENSSGSIQLDPASSLKIRFANVSSIPANLIARIEASAAMSYNLARLNERLHSSSGVRSLFFLPSVSPVGSKCLSLFENSERIDHSIAAILVAYAYSFGEVV